MTAGWVNTHSKASSHCRTVGVVVLPLPGPYLVLHVAPCRNAYIANWQLKDYKICGSGNEEMNIIKCSTLSAKCKSCPDYTRGVVWACDYNSHVRESHCARAILITCNERLSQQWAEDDPKTAHLSCFELVGSHQLGLHLYYNVHITCCVPIPCHDSPKRATER